MKLINLRHRKLQPTRVVAMSNTGELGIENIKIIMEVLVVFLVDIINILKTKNWLLLGQTILKLLSYGNVIALAEMAWQELKNVSQDESEALHQHFKDVLDLENDETELAIETAVGFIPRIYALVEDALAVVGNGQALWKEIKALVQGEEAPDNKRIEKIAAKVAA